jgi:hypothetical protein
MNQWAKTVADLNIRCAWCRRIARSRIRGEPLTYQQQQHITQHVTAVLQAGRERGELKDKTQQHIPGSPKRGHLAD